MNRIAISVVLLQVFALLAITGCQNKSKPDTEVMDADTLVVDTMAQDSVSEVVEETNMPVTADELFDDFFFNFAASKKVQRERTADSLLVTSFGHSRKVSGKTMKYERFFMSQGYYMLILDKYDKIHLVKDTAVGNVMVERFDMVRNTVTSWHFLRKAGLWRMESINTDKIGQHTDHAFLSFYQHFATDSVFQEESLYDPVIFSGPDPEDDFSTMTGELMPEQWPMFAPWLPSGVLYNIRYGAREVKETNFRVVFIRGISNGMEMELLFVRLNGQWRLRKIIT